MKRCITILSSMILLAAICLSMLCGCSLVKKDKDYLYNWMLENGELVKGTALVYKERLDGGKVFTLQYNTDYSHALFATLSMENYEGYQVEVHLPLFTDGKKVLSRLTLVNNEEFTIGSKRYEGFTTGLEYYHTPNSFTNKTPIEYHDSFGDTISMADYPHEYEDGKVIIKVPAEDKRKLEELEQMSSLCNDLSQKVLCDILDWLKTEICPSAKMDMADFGYESYK